jgi:diadenylate cyclase
VQTLERYKARLDEVSLGLATLEIEDLVTLRDVVSVLQRTEMVARIAEEIEGYIVELGDDGRLVRLQLEELLGGTSDERRLVVRDYFHEEAGWHLPDALDALSRLSNDDLLVLRRVAATLHLEGGSADLDVSISPRGYRLLSRIPRLPDAVITAIVERFGDLQKILRASIEDLDDVEGVGETRAQAIKEGLARLTEASILDRYS